MIAIYILMLVLFILQVADGYTTYRGLTLGLIELNPWISWFMNRFGLVDGLIVSKLLSSVLLIGGLWGLSQYTFLGALLAGGGLSLLYAWVVGNNVSLIENRD